MRARLLHLLLWLAAFSGCRSTQEPELVERSGTPPAPVPSQGFAADTRSPRPLRKIPEELGALYGACGEGDEALAMVAQSLADGQKDHPSAEAPPLDRVVGELRAKGSPYVWPRIWNLDGPIDPRSEGPRLREWIAAFPGRGERRCGVGYVRRTDGTAMLLVIAVEVQADLQPLPLQARSGQWHRLASRLTVAATQAKVTLLPPGGAPREVPASLSEGWIRSTFSLDRRGLWTVQVSAATDSGPRPVAEASIYVDQSPDELVPVEKVPGADVADASDDAATLARMLAAVRSGAGLGSLTRDRRLDELAVAHLRAMQAHGGIGHDVGHGSPQVRVEGAGLAPRAVGENVARAPTLRQAHENLWHSPSHRGAMLTPFFTHVGLAVARDSQGSVWVVELFAEFPKK